MRSPYKEWFELLLDCCSRLQNYKRFKNRSLDQIYRTGLRFLLLHAFELHDARYTNEYSSLFISRGELSYIPKLKDIVQGKGHLSCGDITFPERLYAEAVKYRLVQSGDCGIKLSKVKSRRSSGIYYTPNIIVDHMIRETIMPLVRGKNSRQIMELKICDPAMGTGRFLFAAAEFLFLEYIKRADAGKILDKGRIYSSIVKNCIYGIDKDPIAFSITLSRFMIKTGNPASGFRSFFLKDTLVDEFPFKFKFDAVVGNPPWLTFGLRDVQKIDPDQNNLLRERYPGTAEYKISVFSLFIEQAVNITKAGGYHSFIIPDSWLTGKYYYKLRRFLLKSTKMMRLILIKKDFWKDLSIGSCMIYLLKRETGSNKMIDSVIVRKPEELKTIKERNVRISRERIAGRGRSRIFLFRDEFEKEIVEKMEDSGDRLGEYIRFYSGLIGRKGRDSIIRDDISPDSCFSDRGRVIVSGKDLEREKLVFTGNYILHDQSLYKSGYSTNKYIEPKLFVNQTGDYLKAFYDENGYYCLNNIHIGNSVNNDVDLKFISCLLNSRIMNFYYRITSMEYGRALAQVDIDFLHDLPFSKDPKIPGKIMKILNTHQEFKTEIISSDHIEHRVVLPSKYRDMIEKLLCSWYGVDIPDNLNN